MLKRIPVSAVLAGLALTGALSACASANQSSAAQSSATQPGAPQHSASAAASPSAPSSPTSPAPSSAGANSPSAPVEVAPIIFAVKLGRSFQPSTLRISPGQHFEVIVESSVKAGNLGLSGSCSGATTGINGGMLTVRCTSGSYYYTAERAGTTELTATVRPNCGKGKLCPQWVAVAMLKIYIT